MNQIFSIFTFIPLLLLVLRVMLPGVLATSTRGDIIPRTGRTLFIGVILNLILAVVAIILGTIGLVRSIRRPRTVKGIVLSGIGLGLGICGLVFSFISLFITGIFSLIIAQM